MAGDVRGFALEKANVLSGRLKELLSLGQGYVRAQFGVDLGLKPELYPTWVILSSAAAGLLLLLGLSWAAVCGGRLAGKRRGTLVTRSEPAKASSGGAKTEEPRKRSKKKSVDKKAQSNGQPVTAAQVEVKETEAVSRLPPQIKTEKVHEVLAPAQVKKNKKKAKAAEVKPVQHVSTYEGKELDDAGAWETKVSNREKRQQRRKDKSSEDSGSSGGVEASKTYMEAPAASRKNRGNHESLHARTTGKRDTSATSSRGEKPTGNGPGWTDISTKSSTKMGAMEGTKWSGIPSAPHYRAQSDSAQPWAQEAQAWSGVDGRMKADLSPGSFSMMGLNSTVSNSLELQWTSRPVDDEWSGVNGSPAVDPSSDWNAPVEHWGNYEAPPVLMTPAPLLKEQPAPNKVSEDEKDGEDQSGGAAKSKKKRRKKKQTEEEAASDVQTVNTAPTGNSVLKPQELPVLISKKQNTSISSSQKKPEQTAEPPKPSQKKKARKET